MVSQNLVDAFSDLNAALDAQGDTVVLLAMNQLDEDPNNPRSSFDLAELEGLAQTIREKGLLQPITVAPADGEGRHMIRFGARRFRAAKLAGLTEIRVLIQARTQAQGEALIEQLIENDQREGLNTAELAKAVARLLDLKLKQADIAARLGRPPEQISMLASIRSMPDDLQRLAPLVGARTLYELASAWKADAGRVKVWLAGRDPQSITQAAARQLAGRPVKSREFTRDPSDGSVRDARPASGAPAEALPPPKTKTPARAKADVRSSLTATFEVRAGDLRGVLVLDDISAASRHVRICDANGLQHEAPAANVRIVRVRPG